MGCNSQYTDVDWRIVVRLKLHGSRDLSGYASITASIVSPGDPAIVRIAPVTLDKNATVTIDGVEKGWGDGYLLIEIPSTSTGIPVGDHVLELVCTTSEGKKYIPTHRPIIPVLDSGVA